MIFFVGKQKQNMSRIAATHAITKMNLIIIIVLSNPHYPGATLFISKRRCG